jgi:hypothetical protein
MWHCQCNCDGRTKDVLGLNLKRGFIKSCGCIRRETAAKLGSIRIAEIKSTPEFEAKRKAHAVRATKSKKYREDSSKRLLKLWQKDSYREAVERGHALNNWGEKQREARKRLWQDPKYRSKQMRTRKRSKAYRHRQFRKRIPMERTRII